MATVGQALTAPESGWRRYDDNNLSIQYTGIWTHTTNSTADYGSTNSYSNTGGSTLTFKFKGTKLRIITIKDTNRDTAVQITIDGVVDTYSENAATAHQIVVYEKIGLTDGTHTVEIKKTQSGTGYISLDAIDIDDIGILGLFPATTGQLRTEIKDMQIGDFIPCNYQAASGAAGTFSGLGAAANPDIPVAGSATPNGTFYLVKVDKGFLVSDRVVQQSISWDVLNAAGRIQGYAPPVYNPGYSSIDVFATYDWGDGNSTYSKVAANDMKVTGTGTATGEARWKWAASTTRKHVMRFNVSKMTLQGGAESHIRFLDNTSKTWLNLMFLADGLYYGVTTATKICTLAEATGVPIVFAADFVNQVAGLSVGNTNYVLPWAALDGSTWVTTNDITVNLFTKSTATSETIFKSFEVASSASVSITNRIGLNGIVRSLTGGVAYADANGNPVTTIPAAEYGAWPPINEWEKYIVNSDLGGKATKGDNNVWHFGVDAWMQDTATNGLNVSGTIGNNTHRMIRGNTQRRVWLAASSTSTTTLGFRPVFEYKEV